MNGKKLVYRLNESLYGQKQYIAVDKIWNSRMQAKGNPTVLGPDMVKDSPLYLISLIYVITGSRPDFGYIVAKLSQNMSKFTKANLNPRVSEEHN